MIAPLWLLTEGYLVYGLTSLFYTVQLETLTYTTSELREDLIASIHAVLLAPVLEELCFRQMAISPFRRRGAQVAVCVVMAVLFGILHVRNSPGAFFAAMVYGLVFIWSRNIWCGITLHAGADRGQSPVRLPDVLATPEAMRLWEKTQKAGYVDEHFQPLLSRTQAALLADAMAERLGIREKWKVFETLWDRRNMRGDYSRALNQRGSLDFQDKIKLLFCSI